MKRANYAAEALKTFERIHPARSYYPNKRYKSPEGLIYYINKAGYLHAYRTERRSTPDKSIVLYCIIDYRLNIDNTLTETSADYYSTSEALKEAAQSLAESAIIPD